GLGALVAALGLLGAGCAAADQEQDPSGNAGTESQDEALSIGELTMPSGRCVPMAGIGNEAGHAYNAFNGTPRPVNNKIQAQFNGEAGRVHNTFVAIRCPASAASGAANENECDELASADDLPGYRAVTPTLTLKKDRTHGRVTPHGMTYRVRMTFDL